MPPAPENKSIPRIVAIDYGGSLFARASVLEHEALRVAHVVNKTKWQPAAPMSDRQVMGSVTWYGSIVFLGLVRVLNGWSCRLLCGFVDQFCGVPARRRLGSEVKRSTFLPYSVIAVLGKMCGFRFQ